MDYPPRPTAEQPPAPPPLRAQLAAEQLHTREQLAMIFRKGGHVALGTPEARDAWEAGIPELVAAVLHHFTPEEIEIIVRGSE